MDSIFDNKNNEKDFSDNLNSCCSHEHGYSSEQNVEDKTGDKYKKEIALCEEKNKNLERSIAYLRADIENMRRQSSREMESKIERAISKATLPFLSVFDDFERVLTHAKKINNAELVSGLELVFQSFFKSLQANDITEIKADGIFDPEYHEAITTIQKPGAEPNTIAEVVQRGFLWKKNILRPAKVIIFN